MAAGHRGGGAAAPEQAEGVLVTQRKCGTCRHFLPGETGAAGQCGHPERRALLGLVIVRAQELACRRGLNDDDWEATVAIRATEDEAARRHTPAVTSHAGAGQPREDAALASQGGPAAEPGDVAAPPAGAAPEEQPGGDAVRRRAGYQGSPPPVQIGGVSRPAYRELTTDGIPIQRRRSTVAEIHTRARSRTRPPRPPAPEAAPEPTGAGAGPLPAADGVRRVMAPPPAPQAGPAPAEPARPVAGAAPVRGESAPRTGALSRPEGMPAPAETAPAAARGRERDVPPAPPAAAAPPAGTPAHWSVPAALPAGKPPSSSLAASRQAWREEWRAAELADHPERRCATCRDYRAAETPGRGWCVNPYAFPTRQLVSGDDLACLSGLGSWWVESDQRWLAKAGPPPAQPTPLADGLIQLLKQSRRGQRWS
jgi:hypothetical protein